MSAKELKLIQGSESLKIDKVLDSYCICIESEDNIKINGIVMYIDRNQAHLLYLYLKEHLNL